MKSGKYFLQAKFLAIGYQEYISSESVQLPWIAFLHIDITSSGENYISGGVVV